MNTEPIWIFDFEVSAFDWLVVFKHAGKDEYYTFHNDNEGVLSFMEAYDPILCGFNCKHYDNAVLKAVLIGLDPEDVKRVNDAIIKEGLQPWQIDLLRGYAVRFDSFDLMDDMQIGLSLKAIEAHLGLDIRETEVDFDLPRPWTDEEYKKMGRYCLYDVDCTEKLFWLRQSYLENKVNLGAVKNLTMAQALYMTNAKLTAEYLEAKAPETPWDDERDYQYPANLMKEFIPAEVFTFYDRLHNPGISSEEIFSSKLELNIDRCEVTVSFGGIHGAIPHYQEEETKYRTIRNMDVASYYPNLIRRMGYFSRNMSNPDLYSQTIDQRVAAKRSGDKNTANALKLVLNTTYGATLNPYNALYDPKNARSVCISGQLFLLELAMHLNEAMETLEIIQLNTDGIMVSFDPDEEFQWKNITEEWQERTGFSLEEDLIHKIVQKDVNNYIEIKNDGSVKRKGGYLVRGISEAGAWNINNNAPVVAEAVEKYFVDGTPVETTIKKPRPLTDFQIISKASHKYKLCYQKLSLGDIVVVQKVNRVYATTNKDLGCLYKRHAVTGKDAKIPNLPEHCLVDNGNEVKPEQIDYSWYIALAKKQIADFKGPQLKRDERKLNWLQMECLALI